MKEFGLLIVCISFKSLISLSPSILQFRDLLQMPMHFGHRPNLLAVV